MAKKEYDVTVKFIGVDKFDTDNSMMDVKVTIKTREQRGFWTGFNNSWEQVREDSKMLTFLRTYAGWYQVIEGNPIKCDNYIKTNPGSFCRDKLSRLWSEARELKDAKEKLAARDG